MEDHREFEEFNFEDEPSPEGGEAPASTEEQESVAELKARLAEAESRLASHDRVRKAKETLGEIAEKFPHCNMGYLEQLARKGASPEKLFGVAKTQEKAVEVYVSKENERIARIVAAKEKELEESYGKVHGAGEGGGGDSLIERIKNAKSEEEVQRLLRQGR